MLYTLPCTKRSGIEEDFHRLAGPVETEPEPWRRPRRSSKGLIGWLLPEKRHTWYAEADYLSDEATDPMSLRAKTSLAAQTMLLL